jgi:hypothetical protein
MLLTNNEVKNSLIHKSSCVLIKTREFPLHGGRFFQPARIERCFGHGELFLARICNPRRSRI